jgi:hypothetical protein
MYESPGHVTVAHLSPCGFPNKGDQPLCRSSPLLPERTVLNGIRAVGLMVGVMELGAGDIGAGVGEAVGSEEKGLEQPWLHFPFLNGFFDQHH